MEVLSPFRFGPDRHLGFDHSRPSFEGPWHRPSLEHSPLFGPRFPPSPPAEMSRISLPSIADILNPAKEEEDAPAGQRRSAGHLRQSASYGGEGQRPTPIQQSSATRLPPTPPMSLDGARKHEPQPLPTFQPQPVPRIDPEAFKPEALHPRSRHASMNEPKPVLNTNVESRTSPTAMSAPVFTNSPELPRGQKRRFDGAHERRSRSPPGPPAQSFPSGYVSTSRPGYSSVSSATSPRDILNRSLSADYPTQQPLATNSQRAHSKDLPPPSTPSTTTSTTLPSQRSFHVDFSPQSQHQPLFQPPYSPQSSPSSTKTSIYDSRVRSRSWQQPAQQQQPPQPPHSQHHPRSPYSSRPQTSPSSSIGGAGHPGVPPSHSGVPTDRYICSTCGKCFSRPSSLRIHSHSHTGEKPFRCSRDGCGKAFSVRSNMKRHEKGCHVGVVVAPGYMPGSVGGAVSGGGAGGMGVSVMPAQQAAQQPVVGLGVRGLPSISTTLPGTRELAPALDNL